MTIRQWQGQRSDVPVVGGDHLLTAKNVTFHVDGQITRRPGMTFLSSDGAESAVSFGNAVTGTFLILVQSDGNVEAVEL